MEKVFEKAEGLAASVKEYINLRIESLKMTAAEKTSAVAANIIAGALALFVGLLFVVFASVALALALGVWMGHLWAGFLTVAGLYLLAGIVVWTARGRLIRFPVMNALIRQLFTDQGNEDETD
jgi:hypothetical protein